MISARQLANSYLARIADDVIQVREIGWERVAAGFVGNDVHQQNIATGYAEQAAMAARTFWHDMGMKR